MKELAYYDGQIGSPDQVMIPFGDRVHFFGDGVYEATLSGNHKIFLLEEHLDRFYSSAKALLASLDRLRLLPGDYRLFPGHLECSTLNWERQHNPFLQPGIQLTEPEEDEDEWDSMIKI